MPGALIHLAAGATLYLIGRLAFKNYFTGEQKRKNNLLLLLICLVFSMVPDFFMGIYYLPTSSQNLYSCHCRSPPTSSSHQLP
jgi:hypothetical protein